MKVYGITLLKINLKRKEKMKTEIDKLSEENNEIVKSKINHFDMLSLWHHLPDYHFDNPQCSSSGLAFPENQTSSPTILSFLINYCKKKEEELSLKIIVHTEDKKRRHSKYIILDESENYYSDDENNNDYNSEQEKKNSPQNSKTYVSILDSDTDDEYYIS